jgi:hypothetical protein
MSITVSSAEIEELRSSLAAYPEALAALDELADCEGDLEDASISLAIQVGQEPDTSDRWIDGLAKRWRYVVCQSNVKESFEQGLFVNALLLLTEHTTLPLKLATPVAIYVLKTGATNFCQSFDAKIQ